MKLADLGLKTKPATKYISGGYIKFYTSNGQLCYFVYHVTKTSSGSIYGDRIRDKQTLDDLLNMKSITQFVNYKGLTH